MLGKGMAKSGKKVEVNVQNKGSWIKRMVKLIWKPFDILCKLCHLLCPLLKTVHMLRTCSRSLTFLLSRVTLMLFKVQQYYLLGL